MVNSKEELFELFSTFAKTKNWQDKISRHQLSFYSSIHIAILCTRIYLSGDGSGWRGQISVYSAFMPVAFHLLLRQPFGQNWNQSRTRENTWSTRSDLTLISLDFKVVFYGLLAYYSNSYSNSWIHVNISLIFMLISPLCLDFIPRIHENLYIEASHWGPIF